MTDVITNSQDSEIADPKLRKVLTRVAREIELSIEKVAANHTKPKEFPLPPDPNSTERILAARFNALPKELKNRAGDVALERINAPVAGRKKHFGDLAAVNLNASVAIGEQARAMPMPAALKLTQADLTNLTGHNGALAGDIGVVPPKLKKLEMRLHNVKCLDETGGFFERFGNDEIDLGGAAVDETGDTHTIAKFRVGSNFDDGEQVNFRPLRSFTTFDLTEGKAFPKSYFVTLVLAEVDMGGLSDFLNKVVKKVKEKVIAAIGAAIGVSGGPLGIIIGAAVGFVVGKVFDLLQNIWSDDIFKPVTASIKIASLNSQWPGGKTDSPEQIATFSGHGGKYQVTYDWRMLA